MADPTDSYLGLLDSNDLAGFNQSVVQSDPYGMAGRSLGAWQPDMSTWSPTEVGVTSFAKSFLSGLLGNYAQQNAANQLNSVISVLPQLREDPLSVATPEGVDAAPFSALRANSALKYFAAKDAGAAEKQKNINTLMTSIFGEGIKNETIDPKDAIRAIKDNDYSSILNKESTDTSKNPNSKDYKVNQDLFKIEQTYTDKLLTGAEPQRVMAMNRASTNILEAIKKNNPLAASTAIFEYAKLQDSQGTVREADEMRVADPGGPLGILAQIHNQITGEGKLTDSAKKAMRELVPILQENSFREYNQLKDNYLEAAKGYGANPDRIKYIKPTDLSPYMQQVPDRDVLATEAAALRAQGMQPSEVAATLRSKYGG